MLWFQDWGILCGSRIVTSLRKRDLHGIPPATAGPQSEGASDSSLRIPSGTIYFLIVLFAFPEVLSTLSLSPVPAREWHFRCRCPIRDHPRSWSVRNCWRRTHRDRLGGRQYYVLSEPVPIAFDCRFERPESAVCGQRAFSGAQPLRRFTWTQLSDAALYSDEHRNTARSPARSGTERRLPSQREPTLSPGRGAEPCWRCPLL